MARPGSGGAARRGAESARHVRLEPLGPQHARDLAEELGSDDDVWRWLVDPPGDEAGMPAFIDGALAERAARGPVPVRGRRGGLRAHGRVLVSFLDIVPEHRRIEIGWTFYARRVWRVRGQHRVQAAAARARVRRPRVRAGGAQDRTTSTSGRRRRSPGSARPGRACCATTWSTGTAAGGTASTTRSCPRSGRRSGPGCGRPSPGDADRVSALSRPGLTG